MPKTSTSVPTSQASVDRLHLGAGAVRGNDASASLGFCHGLSPCSCFEAEAQGAPGIGGPMCVCLDCEPAVMGTLCPFCFEGDAE